MGIVIKSMLKHWELFCFETDLRLRGSDRKWKPHSILIPERELDGASQFVRSSIHPSQKRHQRNEERKWAQLGGKASYLLQCKSKKLFPYSCRTWRSRSLRDPRHGTKRPYCRLMGWSKGGEVAERPAEKAFFVPCIGSLNEWLCHALHWSGTYFSTHTVHPEDSQFLG